MIISSLTGDLIVKAVVPDSSEIYCSPIVADIQNDGNQWVLYGTGGENLGGSFYAVHLSDLLLGDISSSIVLDTDPNKGYIAPASIYQNNSNGIMSVPKVQVTAVSKSEMNSASVIKQLPPSISLTPTLPKAVPNSTIKNVSSNVNE